MRAVLCLALTLTACTSGRSGAGADTGPSPDDTGLDDDDTGLDDSVVDWVALAEEIDALRDEAGVPGLGYVLVYEDEVLVAGGVGMANLEEGVPVTAETPFMLASISKTFTGMSLLQVRESGLLDLEDPVDDHLPWVLDNPRVEDEQIEVRHLVTHTSGLRDEWIWGAPGSGGLYSEGDSDISLAEIMEGYFVEGGEWYDATANFTPFSPGARYEYCNMASALAGYLVETTTGTALKDHAPVHLFEPLGMTDTAWQLDYFDDPLQVAMPYRIQGGEPVATGQYGYPDYPDGMLRSSPADLGRYMAMMLSGGELDGARVLEESSIDLALDDVLEDHAGQGVFWYRYRSWGEEVACHSGGDYGVSTELCLALESRLGVAVVANLDTSDTSTALYAVEGLLIEAGREVAAAR